MIDCDYCGESFDDEDAYLDHLERAHEIEELGAIDVRRLESRGKTPDSDGLPPIVYYGAGLSILLLAFGLVFYTISIGTSSADERIHEHGFISVTIDGEPIDFDQSAYTAEGSNPNPFHFHAGDPNNDPADGEYYWHLHPERISLAEAMTHLGFELTASTLTIEETTYDETDADTDLSVTINGEPVDPDEEIHEGDRIEITVDTDA